jgi:hypothetical protein
VDAPQLGATLPLAVRPGAVLHLAAVRLAGVEVVEAGHQVGVEMADAQRMVAVMETGLLTVAAMAPEQLMVEQLHMEARLLMVEARHTAVTMARALLMEALTRVTGRLLGVALQATPRRSHRVVYLLPLLVHTTRQHRVLMQPPLPVLMVRTQRLHLVVHLWMLRRQETSQLPHLEIPDISTGQRLPLHRHQVLGNLRRRLPVERIRGTIEVKFKVQCKISFLCVAQEKFVEAIRFFHLCIAGVLILDIYNKIFSRSKGLIPMLIFESVK